MKKKMIVGIVIVAIVALTGIGLYLKDKGKQKLDTYSESVGTQTDADAKEIVDGNGAHFFEAGKFLIYIPSGYTRDTSDESVYYWKGNMEVQQSPTDVSDCEISISYDPGNIYDYDELKNVYYDNIQKNFEDINMTTIHMDGKNFACYEYSGKNYFYSTVIFTEYVFGKNGKHLCCITAKSNLQAKDSIKDIIILIAGNSVLKGE